MKKKIAILPLLVLSSVASLVSCGNNNNNESNYGRLTYGTYCDEGAIKISYTDLTTRINHDENMAVVVYPGDDSTCGCWMVFERVIDRFVKNYNIRIYKISYDVIEANGNPWGFVLDNSSPVFHIVKERKVVKSIHYLSTIDPEYHKIFTSEDELYLALKELVDMPNLYYVNQDYLDNVIDEEKTFGVYYGRSKCGDCNFVEPYLLHPYANSHAFKNKMLVIDLQDLYSGDAKAYQDFKDEHGLSVKGNATYGYNTGVVPTFQFIENGVIKDASVFFNDTVEQINGQYKITNTYYTEERKDNLYYLSNLKDGALSVLENLIIPDEAIEVPFPDLYPDYKTWSQAEAAKYHSPLLTAFLDTYLI